MLQWDWEWIRHQAMNVPKSWLVAMGGILWMHGVTVGIVFEGQEGLLNRFWWTFVLSILPALAVSKHKRGFRFAAAWVYFEVCTFIMCCSNSMAWYRNPKNLNPLPDLGHDLLPEWVDVHTIDPLTGTWTRSDAEKIPDVIMTILFVVTLIFGLCHRQRLDIFRRFFIIYGTLCIMRSVTVIATSLPDSSKKCRMMTPTGNLSSGASGWDDITARDVLIRSVKLLVPVGEVTCGDMVFSGHSILMVLCAMVWHTYYKWVRSSINWVKVSIWILALFGMLSIVWTRMHYTIDVVLAVYFAVTIWSSYHRFVNDIRTGHRFSAVWIIDAFIIYPAIEWLETVIPHDEDLDPEKIEESEDEEESEEEEDDEVVQVTRIQRSSTRSSSSRYRTRSSTRGS